MSISLSSLRFHLLGRPLRSSELESQKYGVIWGLPVLSSDAISSVAYATEEILLILVPVIGVASYAPMLGAAAIIIALLFMLILCYKQVISAYPQGGGAYSVARANLGSIASLIAASGLVIGYILTIAVSACSGAAAITSAFPNIEKFKVLMIVVFIIILTIGNLRGLRESSVAFGIPTYFFIVSILVMIVTGIIKAAVTGQTSVAVASLQQTSQDLTFFLFLRAFSSGCSALTGVEAISNSVPNFASPAQSNARKTLTILGLIVLVVFGGVCMLAVLYQVTPMADVTVVAQIAQGVFGDASIMFYVIQVATAIILLLAANTAYNGLPQLMSLLAHDKYLPARFSDKGSRLVYSNGIVFASAIAIILVIVYNGETHRLIPLYAGGVFLSFTLAQAGMVAHWLQVRRGRWIGKLLINGFGAIITGIVCVVIIATRFSDGAWIALVAIALAVLVMWSIHRHYETVADNLRFHGEETAKRLVHAGTAVKSTKVIIPAYSVNKPFLKTLNYARALSDDIEVYHVKTSAAQARRFKSDYQKLEFNAPLVIEKAPYRNVNEMLLAHIDERLTELEPGQVLTIVMPQLVTQWYQFGLHNQTTLFIENALLERRDVAVVTIPYIIEKREPNTYKEQMDDVGIGPETSLEATAAFQESGESCEDKAKANLAHRAEHEHNHEHAHDHEHASHHDHAGNEAKGAEAHEAHKAKEHAAHEAVPGKEHAAHKAAAQAADAGEAAAGQTAHEAHEADTAAAREAIADNGEAAPLAEPAAGK